VSSTESSITIVSKSVVKEVMIIWELSSDTGIETVSYPGIKITGSVGSDFTSFMRRESLIEIELVAERTMFATVDSVSVMVIDSVASGLP